MHLLMQSVRSRVLFDLVNLMHSLFCHLRMIFHIFQQFMVDFGYVVNKKITCICVSTNLFLNKNLGLRKASEGGWGGSRSFDQYMNAIFSSDLEQMRSMMKGHNC